VGLTLERGPAPSLKVTARAGGQTSAVTITSATGTPLSLVKPRYECSVPPAPTFCPAKAAGTTSHAYQLRFAATHATGVVLAAIVGPVTTLTKTVVPTTSSPVPPYIVTELMRVIHPATSGSSKPQVQAEPTPSVTAGPGDVVTMYSILKGKVAGAPQPVTVTIDQGPAGTLTVSGAVPGGQTSKATVKSGLGSSIELVLPRYACYVPPYPTFCPATKLKTPPHHYELTFMSAPGVPIVIQSRVVPGA
jgi:hypothetical protein